MPVCPVTPVAITATGLKRSRPVLLAISPEICLVASTLELVFGPRESGVISGFPSPTTSTRPLTGKSLRISFPIVISLSSVSVKLSVSDGSSTVI